VSDAARPVRAVLALSIAAGLLSLAAVPLLRPQQLALASDVYYFAAEALLSGQNPYAAAPPGRPGYTYVYPPLVLLAFVPHALTGSPFGAYLLQTLLNLAAAAALAVVIVRAIEDADIALPRRDRLLVGGFVFASVHSVPVVVMGQVNLQLALAIAVGARLLERDRDTLAGVAFALAASVKLFPAAVGLWLLARRAWRAVAVAVATGLATIALGALALDPALTRTFFTDVLPAERRADAFAGGLDPSSMFVTVRRPLAALLPGLTSAELGVLAVTLLVPVVLVTSRDLTTERDRLVALLATLLATLLVLPLEPFYLVLVAYPLVPLLYRLDPGRVRGVFLAGTAVLAVVITYPAVEGLLALAPLSAATATTLTGLARGLFSVAQPPLVGAVLVLVGCVLHARSAGRQ